MNYIQNYSLEDLRGKIESLGLKPFRANQIFDWIYKKGVDDLNLMKNLAQSDLDIIKKSLMPYTVSVEDHQLSADRTEKFLFKLADGKFVETVFIPLRQHNTVCISTQVGCKFRCSFCASGIHGFARDLSCAEMLAQITHLMFKCDKEISNIVFMGIGEPLDNYENVIDAVKLINSKDALNIGKRKITISTCGLIPQINKLRDSGMNLELSISLHAPTDEIRDKLMPVNSKYPLAQLIKCAKEYTQATKRSVTFEYALIKGVNSSKSCALKLAKIAKDKLFMVNLIPINQCAGLSAEGLTDEEVRNFKNTLTEKGVKVTVRKSRGADIDAACGQLKIRHMSLS